MKINKYPDGASYVTIEYYEDHHPITFKINSYEDLWHLQQYVDAFNSQFEQIPTITIPNLIDAQADRRFHQNESSGLKLVCNFLNKMNANFKIFHPHNPEVVEALMDNVEIIDNTYFIKEVLSKIYCNNNSIIKNKGLFYYMKLNNLTLMSSDAGGFKPLMKLCDKLDWEGEVYSASKSRSYTDGKSQLTQLVDREDFGGKDILIVDDISVYGGTFKGLSKLLRERNCGKLYLAISHMTIQWLDDDPVTNYFDKIFTTNSKFDEYRVPTTGHDKIFGKVPENLEIIKMF